MNRPHYYIPGVPAGGHISGGFWHPGRIDGCPKCPQEGPAPDRAGLKAGPPAGSVGDRGRGEQERE